MMITKECLMKLAEVALKTVRSLPKIARYILTAAISVIVAIILLGIVGCGPVTKITVKSENPNSTTISVSQNRADSTNTSLQINPTINFGQ